MIYIDILYQVITLLSCALIYYRAEPVLNKCHRDHTALRINVAFYLLTVGPFLLGFSILFGYVPNGPTAGVLFGVALLFLCERRVRVLFRSTVQKRQGVA